MNDSLVLALIVTVILGAMAGWLASLVMNRNAEQGWVENIVVGVIGAVVATLILSGFRGTDPFISFNLADVFVAFLGALAVCAVLNLIQRKRIR